MSPELDVVVVGGGFAGIGCARRLAHHDDVHVTVLDRLGATSAQVEPAHVG